MFTVYNKVQNEMTDTHKNQSTCHCKTNLFIAQKLKTFSSIERNDALFTNKIAICIEKPFGSVREWALKFIIIEFVIIFFLLNK